MTVDRPSWELFERSGSVHPLDKTEQFRLHASTGEYGLTFWDDMSWISISRVNRNGTEGPELVHKQIRLEAELPKALTQAGIPPDEAETLTATLWPTTLRSRYHTEGPSDTGRFRRLLRIARGAMKGK